MLLRLSIVNFALIKQLEIQFGHRFSVITGETGAGKSILLGALSLMLGQRSDGLTFPDISSKCSIEGVFDISDCELEDFFTENDLDYDPNCIIRREITPQGKSRAFINDTPVNLTQLKSLTSRLVDVHSQHQTLLLQESGFQLSVVDSVAETSLVLQEYKELYKTFFQTLERLNALELRNKEAAAELDYLTFIEDELSKANLKEGEQELLEQESESLSHAEEIRLRLFQAASLLNDGDDNIIQRLNETGNHVLSASRYLRNLEVCANRIASATIELKDIYNEISRISDQIGSDPARLQTITDRLSLQYQLQQKHRAGSTRELIAFHESIQQRIKGIDSLSSEINSLTAVKNQQHEQLLSLAQQLTEKRRAAIPAIELGVEQVCKQVGMVDAVFKVQMTRLEKPAVSGADKITFLFSANKGVEPAELSRIASGGELSRLMLAVKSLISSKNLLPTIIFDEIDTGISGEIAGKVGTILQEISGRIQVIAITHLPQIAGKSSEHFKVFKFNDQERTFSSVSKLLPDQRIAELALMISGDSESEPARRTAIELLGNNI